MEHICNKYIIHEHVSQQWVFLVTVCPQYELQRSGPKLHQAPQLSLTHVYDT